MKKIFILSAVILAVLLIFWGIYNFAFRDANPGQETAEETDELKEVQSPSGEEKPGGRIQDISNEPVIAPVVSAEGNRILFYAAKDGQVFSIKFDGSGRKIIASQKLEKLTNVLWSSSLKRVISEFEGGARRYVYDYESQKGSPLKNEIRAVSWSNLGDRIIYQYTDGKVNELDVVNSENVNDWNKIADVFHSRIKIAPIPETSLVSFWNYPQSQEEGVLLKVGIFGGETKRIFEGKKGADFLWDPNGKKGLVTYADESKAARINLGMINNDGTGFQSLEIPTLVSKCVWSEDGQTVYYALPGGIPRDAAMPDDYLEGKFHTIDTFWKIDASSRESERLISLGELEDLGAQYDATGLFLSPKGDALFFVNREDRHLYRLDLQEEEE